MYKRYAQIWPQFTFNKMQMRSLRLDMLSFIIFRREEVTLGMTKQEGRELLDVDENDSEEIARNTQLYFPSLKVCLKLQNVNLKVFRWLGGISSVHIRDGISVYRYIG